MKFTDKDFLAKFRQECVRSRIGSTELMLYYVGREIIEQLGGEFEDEVIKTIPIPEIGEQGEV